jgi:hypothetical protein
VTFLPTILNVVLLTWLGSILLHKGWTWVAGASVFAAGLMLGIYIAQECLFRAFDKQRR